MNLFSRFALISLSATPACAAIHLLQEEPDFQSASLIDSITPELQPEFRVDPSRAREDSEAQPIAHDPQVQPINPILNNHQFVHGQPHHDEPSCPESLETPYLQDWAHVLPDEHGIERFDKNLGPSSHSSLPLSSNQSRIRKISQHGKISKSRKPRKNRNTSKNRQATPDCNSNRTVNERPPISHSNYAEKILSSSTHSVQPRFKTIDDYSEHRCDKLQSTDNRMLNLNAPPCMMQRDYAIHCDNQHGSHEQSSSHLDEGSLGNTGICHQFYHSSPQSDNIAELDFPSHLILEPQDLVLDNITYLAYVNHVTEHLPPTLKFAHQIIMREGNVRSLCRDFQYLYKRAKIPKELYTDPDLAKKQCEKNRNDLIEENWKILSNESQTWLRFFGQKHAISVEKYGEATLGQRAREVLPVYLFYVEMINKIVMSEDPNQSNVIKSACELFDDTIESHRGILTDDTVKAKSIKIKPNIGLTTEKKTTFLWSLITTWMQNERASLFSKVRLDTASPVLLQSFKFFFSTIFIVFARRLTDKLKRILPIHSETGPNLPGIYP